MRCLVFLCLTIIEHDEYAFIEYTNLYKTSHIPYKLLYIASIITGSPLDPLAHHYASSVSRRHLRARAACSVGQSVMSRRACNAS